MPNSGAAHGTTSLINISVYTGITNSVTQRSTVTISALNGTTDFIGPVVRVNGTAHTSFSYYSCVENSTTLLLQKVTGQNDAGSGIATQLAVRTITAAAGDTIDLRIVGNTVTCYWNRTGTPTLEYADSSSPLTTGNPGIEQLGSTATLSSFYLRNPIAPTGTTLNIICDGDSLTEGAGVFSPYTDYLYVNSVAPFVANVAVDGKGLGTGLPATDGGTIETMLATGTTVVDPLLVTGATNVVIILGGTNDVANGVSPTAVYGYLQTYIANRRGAGWKVVVFPLPSHTGVTDTPMQAYNKLVIANTAGADAVATLPQSIIGTHSYSNTILFVDGIHMTQFALTSILAPAVSAAIN